MDRAANLFKNILRAKLSARGAAADLARKLAVAPSNISQLLASESAPTLETLDRVAAALGLEPWELLKPADAKDPASRDTIREALGYLATLDDDQVRALALPFLKSLKENLARTQPVEKDRKPG